MFIEWLDQQLKPLGWSDHQLAKRAGISHSVVSKARAGIAPKWEACMAIAAALDLPAEIVFRRAGLLPEADDTCPELAELHALLVLLPEQDRRELVQIARLKIRLHRECSPPSLSNLRR